MSLGGDPATRKVTLLLLAICVVHAIDASLIGLADAEAYYWLWSRELSLSYYDHPPLVAWLIRAASVVFGNTPLAVRAPFILMHLLSAWVMAKTVGDLNAPPASRVWAVALVAVTPMFFVSGLVATPDSPVIFATTLVVFFVVRAHKKSRWAPLGIGLSIGFGILAKLSMVVVAGSALAVTLARPQLRVHFRSLPIWIGILAAVVVPQPILIWNIAHDFATWTYQSSRVGGFSWLNFGRWVGGQIGYYSPFICAGVVAVLIRKHRDDLGLRHLAWPTFVVNSYLILRTTNAEPQWTALAYVPGLILLATRIPDWLARWPRSMAVVKWASVGLFSAILVALHIHVLTDWFIRGIAGNTYRPRVDLANDLAGWDEVAIAVKNEADQRSGMQPVVAAASHYTLCGQLAFALRDSPEVVCMSPRRDAFDFIEGRNAPTTGATVIFVADDRFSEAPTAHHVFDHCELPRTIQITKGPHTVRRFEITTCNGYRGERS